MPQVGKKQSNDNYFLPLQTIDVEDDLENNIDSNSDEISVVKKERIPPITVLKKDAKCIHTLMKSNQIKDYYIKTISIGIKLFLDSSKNYSKTCALLKSAQCEFFSHDTKFSRPYKAILSGIDNANNAEIKNSLIELGLKCIEVKTIERTTRFGLKMVLFIVYFENKSISLQQLKQNYCYINHYKVRWEHKSKPSGKLTQCHRCQLYGHGSKYCCVKILCAYCAGPHLTCDCPDPTHLKCANCKGSHSSMDLSCPCRSTYAMLINRRDRTNKRKNDYSQHYDEENYPSMFNNQNTQHVREPNMHWSNLFKNNENIIDKNRFSNINNNTNNNSNCNAENNNLFSLSEINSLVNDMLCNLSKCKTKQDQFTVIADLTFKYLYSK